MKQDPTKSNSPISFSSKLTKLEGREASESPTVLRLPTNVSKQLPSRGIVMVNGTINGSSFKVALEPDGQGSHWFKVGNALLQKARAQAGDTVSIAIEPTKDWTEPKIPTDLEKELNADTKVKAIWLDITPMARWDWIRWISSAKQEETRQRRVKSIGSRLKSGKRRPCCFDRTQCTLTDA